MRINYRLIALFYNWFGILDIEIRIHAHYIYVIYFCMQTKHLPQCLQDITNHYVWRIETEVAMNRIACTIQQEVGRSCVWVIRRRTIRKREADVMNELEKRVHIE